jgi:uncharacterized coiled-coil DUF342 family protein
MKKILAIAVITLCPALWGNAASAQDCRFKIKADESLKQAMNSFHEVMSGLVHGAAGKGDFSQVKAKAEELAKLRDGIMAANLPEKLAKRCPEISIKAAELSKAVDSLVAQSRGSAGDDAVKLAFDNMHTAYRNLNNALVSLEDQMQAFHEVMHPLWHDAYPKKDAAAIKAEVPKLKVRAKLILSTAEAVDKAKVAGAKSLLEAVTTLEEAAAANDDASVLEALRVAHEVYEKLASGTESHP